MRFEATGGIQAPVAWSLIVYTAIIYEVIGYLSGHGLTKGPMFGVAPCPTGIFTIGFLLLARGRAVIWLSLIPIAWALVGTSAAIYLGVPEDLGLPVAMVALLSALVLRVKPRPAA